MVGDDDTIHSIFDGILNILFGGDYSQNMILSVCGTVYMIEGRRVFAQWN